jgi:tetratricopeptide (TPR) repeat protein
MKFRKKITVTLLFIVYLSHSQSNIDSLEKVLQSSAADTSRAKTMLELASAYARRGALDKVAPLAQEANTICKKNSNKKGEANSEVLLGNVAASLTRNYEEAFVHYNRAMKLYNEINYPVGTGKVYQGITIIYKNQGKNHEALESLNKAIDIYEKANEKEGRAKAFSTMGLIYSGMGKYPEALNSFFKSLKIHEELKFEPGICNALDQIGYVLSKQKKFDEAQSYYDNSLARRQKQNSKKEIATSYSYLGILMYDTKKFPEALKYFQMSVQLLNEIGDWRVGTLYGNLGNAYEMTGNQEEALKYKLLAVEHSKQHKELPSVATFEISSGNTLRHLKKFSEARQHIEAGLKVALSIGHTDAIQNGYSSLSELDEATGNALGALKNYKLAMAYKDSIFNSEAARRSLEAQVQYDFDKKEQEAKLVQEKKDALAQEEKQKQKLLRNFFMAGFGLLLLVAVLIFMGYRNKQKANHIISAQKQQVEAAKNEIELQKITIELKQKEMMDSIFYAKRIQTALITSEKYIQRNMERLNG